MFWIQVAARLVFRTDLIPIFNGIEGLLFFALLAAPGNIRAALFITLGPNRKAYPNTDVDDLAPVRDPKKRRRIRFRLRRSLRRERGTPTSPEETAWDSQNLKPSPTSPALTVMPSAALPAPAIRRGSTGRLLLKVLVGTILFAVCGGYWLTGGIIIDPSDTITEPPRLRNEAEKRHMLDLINEARAANGALSVAMGSNNVAQIQADRMLEECVFSHWGTDGLKPYIRYSLAGGYQNNGENILTSNECGLTGTWIQWNEHPKEMAKNAVEGFLESLGHRKTMLDPSYSMVNIGLAWDRNTFKAVQHFEGDFVEYDALPKITDGKLELEGRLKNGHRFTGDLPLLVLITYDPTPLRLTKGQLVRTTCYSSGELLAFLMPQDRLWQETHQGTRTFEEPECVDPYSVGGSVQDPVTVTEMAEIWEQKRADPSSTKETESTLTLRRAEEITAEGGFFSVTADLEEVLDEYGPGVYTVLLLANLEDGPVDEEQVISEYSVFHRVRPPETYGSP